MSEEKTFKLFEALPQGVFHYSECFATEEEGTRRLVEERAKGRNTFLTMHVPPEKRDWMKDIPTPDVLSFNGTAITDVPKYLAEAEVLKYCESLRWTEIFRFNKWITDEAASQLISNIRNCAHDRGIHIH